jgi:hypothetical protein
LFCCLYSNIFENDILERGVFITHCFDRDTVKSDVERFEYAETLLRKICICKAGSNK